VAAHSDFSALSDDALASERALARDRVYSREGQQEVQSEYADPVTGRTVSLRASEWRLLQLERELDRRAARDAGTAGSDDPDHALGSRQSSGIGAAPGTAADAGVAASAWSRPDGRHRLRRSALPFGIGLLVGVMAALATTGVLRAPDVAMFGAGPAEQTQTQTPGDYRALLSVFSREEPESRTEPRLPAVLESSFAADDVAIVFLPTNGNTGTRVYAARRDASQLCLVAVIPTQQLAVNCGELVDVARGGLSLHFWLTDGLQQARSLLGDNVDITASMATVSWNPDGTFGITQTPID
jgi:hypothetical protein